MISFQLVFFTTLAVNVYGQHILHSPVSFKYLENDTLILKLVLENVPSDITQYLLHVRTDRHGPKISHITPKNGTHNVKTKLNVKNVVLDLEIKNNGQTSAIFNILNGTQSTGVDGRSEFREQCLNHYDKNYCSIKVDFKKRCEDDSSLECHVKDETLTSFSGNNGHSEVTAWSQHYIARKESSVSLPSTKVKGNSYMKMKMYKFDSNTQLSMETEFSKKYYNVSVPVEKAEDYELETSYIDENQTSYSFTCKGAESRISALYYNCSKIYTYDRKSLNWTKPIDLVNILFCCVQYKISKYGADVIVERIVDQFTQIRIKPTQIQKTNKPMCTMKKDYILQCTCPETPDYKIKWSQVITKNYKSTKKEQEILWSYETKSLDLSMKIYKFDNNTEIKCEDINQRTTKVNTAQNTYSINIPDVKNKTGQYNTLKDIVMNTTIPSYSECATRAIIRLIHPNDEIIERMHYNKNSAHKVCCISFEDPGTLIRDIKIISSLSQTSMPGTPNTTTSPLKDNQDEAESSTGIGLYVILPTLLIVVILLLILGLYFKKRRNSSQSQQMLQLETYGTTEKVLYAELAIEPRNDTRVVVRTNESPYAEIIGVLHTHR